MLVLFTITPLTLGGKEPKLAQQAASPLAPHRFASLGYFHPRLKMEMHFVNQCVWVEVLVKHPEQT